MTDDDTLVDVKTFDVELHVQAWRGDRSVPPGTSGSMGCLHHAVIGGHTFSILRFADAETVRGIDLEVSPFAVLWLEGYTNEQVAKLGVTEDDWAEDTDADRVGLFVGRLAVVEMAADAYTFGGDPHDRSIV